MSNESSRYCPECSTARSGATCWKCGTETFEPHPDWANPKMPDLEAIRSAARVLGYAVAVHGSQERDLDLIATPWVSDAVSADAFIRRLAERINARVLETELKPLGRIAASLQIDGYYKIVDLSVVVQNPNSN